MLYNYKGDVMAKMKTVAIPEQQRQCRSCGNDLMEYILEVVKSANKYSMQVELIYSVLKYAQKHPNHQPIQIVHWARKDWDL